MSPFQFLADPRQQLPLFLGDRPESQDAARSGRDSHGIREQFPLARFAFPRGKYVEDRSDRLQRSLEELAGGTLGQPCSQLPVGCRAWLDAPRPRRLNDQVALASRHAAFRPSHLHERHEVKQLHRVGRETEHLQIIEGLFIGHARLLPKAAALRTLFGTAPDLFDELLVSFPKVVVLERTAPVSECVFLGHIAPPSISIAPGPHPRRELTLMPRLGFPCPRLGMAADAMTAHLDRLEAVDAISMVLPFEPVQKLLTAEKTALRTLGALCELCV